MLERMSRNKSLHRITIHGDTVYTAGVAAADIDQDMAGQTRQICARIDELLAMAGTDRTKLLTALIFITDMAAKPEMDRVWTEWVAPEHLPCRATLGVASLGDPRCLIEVVTTAAR